MITEEQAEDLIDQRVAVTAIKEGWSGPEVKIGFKGKIVRVSGEWVDVVFDGAEETDYTMCHVSELSPEDPKKGRK